MFYKDMFRKEWYTGQELKDEFHFETFELYEAHHKGYITAILDGIPCERRKTIPPDNKVINRSKEEKIAFMRLFLSTDCRMSEEETEEYDIGFNTLSIDEVPKARFHCEQLAEWRRGVSRYIPAGQPDPPVPDAGTAKAKTQGGDGTGGRAKPKRKNLPVSQRTVAVLCGVSLRTVQGWEEPDGRKTPQRYPGRLELSLVKAFAETYKCRKLVNAEARQADRAKSVAPDKLDRYAYKRAFDFDDE
ncbi:MAG: hypothetical protein LBR82_07405 [Desulfovibrio sp.]|jgi:DNA-binding transcriptional regulator YiaG|nr:hypothetical protein [Desulfovibrio sp.]